MDAKYEQRKKMIYDFMCDDMYVPMKIKELAIVLGVKKDQRPQLEQILNDLMMEGRIVCSKRGKFSKSEEKKITGTFQAHPKGFGFVSVEGEKEDIFIPESETNGAMHMDTVEISVSPAVTGRRREGKVLHVLERGMKQVVCTYQLNKNFGFAVPDNPKFGAGLSNDTLEVILVKTDDLKENVKLCLKLVSNDYFQGTMQQYEQIKIIFNNVVSKPEWWTTQVTKVYLGTYSRKKYEEFVKCTGVTNFGALNTAEKRAYSLTFKRYIAQNNVMDVDADGKEFPMTVPIN